MGMGMCPVSTWRIYDAKLGQLCPRQFGALQKSLESNEMTIEGLADCLAREEDVPEDVMKAYERLCVAFNKKTKKRSSTLDLTLSYHSDSDGDRYDDVRGAFWEVTGVQTLTPAAKAIRNGLERVQYVVYG
jgi:hypothetical protein